MIAKTRCGDGLSVGEERVQADAVDQRPLGITRQTRGAGKEISDPRLAARGDGEHAKSFGLGVLVAFIEADFPLPASGQREQCAKPSERIRPTATLLSSGALEICRLNDDDGECFVTSASAPVGQVGSNFVGPSESGAESVNHFLQQRWSNQWKT